MGLCQSSRSNVKAVEITYVEEGSATSAASSSLTGGETRDTHCEYNAYRSDDDDDDVSLSLSLYSNDEPLLVKKPKSSKRRGKEEKSKFQNSIKYLEKIGNEEEPKEEGHDNYNGTWAQSVDPPLHTEHEEVKQENEDREYSFKSHGKIGDELIFNCNFSEKVRDGEKLQTAIEEQTPPRSCRWATELNDMKTEVNEIKSGGCRMETKINKKVSPSPESREIVLYAPRDVVEQSPSLECSLVPRPTTTSLVVCQREKNQKDEIIKKTNTAIYAGYKLSETEKEEPISINSEVTGNDNEHTFVDMSREQNRVKSLRQSDFDPLKEILEKPYSKGVQSTESRRNIMKTRNVSQMSIKDERENYKCTKERSENIIGHRKDKYSTKIATRPMLVPKSSGRRSKG